MMEAKTVIRILEEISLADGEIPVKVLILTTPIDISDIRYVNTDEGDYILLCLNKV